MKLPPERLESPKHLLRKDQSLEPSCDQVERFGMAGALSLRSAEVCFFRSRAATRSNSRGLSLSSRRDFIGEHLKVGQPSSLCRRQQVEPALLLSSLYGEGLARTVLISSHLKQMPGLGRRLSSLAPAQQPPFGSSLLIVQRGPDGVYEGW